MICWTLDVGGWFRLHVWKKIKNKKLFIFFINNLFEPPTYNVQHFILWVWVVVAARSAYKCNPRGKIATAAFVFVIVALQPWRAAAAVLHRASLIGRGGVHRGIRRVGTL